ncbi:hypothetical protein HD554DRAFT_2029467, partial [Boletus coccyginus]
QPSLNGHLVPTDTIIQYSDSAFHDAAIEYLVATDQPIHAMKHPMFQKMLKIASCAPGHNKIKLPGRTTTREPIIKKFKIDLLSL